jgi:hypothetical protein
MRGAPQSGSPTIVPKIDGLQGWELPEQLQSSADFYRDVATDSKALWA